MDATSAVGGYADGVLGCTTDAGQITLIQGWNFYAGSDAAQIGAGQYDFEAVVTHELGHALGLGHSTDSTSVMYATLNTGSVNRSLTTADLNVPDSDTGGACGLHAAVPRGSVLSGVNAAAELAGSQNVSSVPPVSDAASNFLFVFLGTEPNGLPLGARQLPGRSGEPSRTGSVASDAVFANGMIEWLPSQDFALSGTRNSSPIFAGQPPHEDDEPLVDVP